MKRFGWIGLIAVFVVGCIANHSLSDASIAEANVSNLSRISLGMKEPEVLGIMHTPHKQEAYRVAQDTYHVWLYITSYRGLGQIRLLRPNLTPLVFKNSTLIGVGYVYYHWLKKPHKPAPEPHAQPPKPPEIEDTNLERSLQRAFQPSGQPPGHPPGQPSGPTTPKAPSSPSQKPTSMSTPPPKPPPENAPPPSDKPEWNEEDEQMIQEESDQNFNFW